MENPLQLKKQIHETCKGIIERKLQVVDENLLSIRESRDNETKSSAGDKYETGRAMMQIEEANTKARKSKILEDLNALESIPLRETSGMVEDGAIVKTRQLNFYISIALGKIECGGAYYYCISKNSPIGRQMYGKRKGDIITVNQRAYEVLEVW